MQAGDTSRNMIASRCFSSQLGAKMMKPKARLAAAREKLDDMGVLKGLVKQRAFPELIIMIKSYLMAGRVEQAERLFGQLKLTRLADWWEFSREEHGSQASGLLNMFVQAYLEAGKPEQALEHVRAQSKQKNTLTYALLLRYHLGVGEEERCRAVLREMKAGGFLLDGTVWEHLHRTRVLTRSELDRLIPLVYSLEGRGSEAVALKLADLGITDEAGEESDLKSVPSPLVEEVKAIQSNSHGIDFIKQALSALRQAHSTGSPHRVDAYALQERLERDCSQAASEQFKWAMGQFLEMSGAPNVIRVRRLMAEWHELLTEHIRSVIAAETSFTGGSEAKPAQLSAGSKALDGGRVLYAALLASLSAHPYRPASP